MVKDRRCPKCQYDRFTLGFAVDVAGVGAPRKQKTKHGYRTQDEAKQAMDDLLQGSVTNSYVPPSKMTLGTYLEQE